MKRPSRIGVSLRVLLIRKDFKRLIDLDNIIGGLRVLLIRKDFKPPKSSVKSSVLSSANDNLTEYRKRATNPEISVLRILITISSCICAPLLDTGGKAVVANATPARLGQTATLHFVRCLPVLPFSYINNYFIKKFYLYLS